MKKNQNKPNCNNIGSVRRPAYTTGAFTLVELIVVITILAILGTIAFISLQGYSSQARDSKRLSDIQNIKKSVELFSLNTGKYPKPDDSFTVSYSGETLRYQGIVGDQVSTNLSRNLNEKPVDPITGLEYTYSTTHSQTEYEVLGLYESDLISTSPQPPAEAGQASPTGEGVAQLLIQKSNAASLDYPKIDGNYNGIYVKTLNYYLPTPSIINGNIWGNLDFADDETLIKSQVVTGGNNIPLTSTGWLSINLSAYTGTITENSTDEQKSNLVQKIQTAYSGSQLASDTMYADILSRTSTGEMVDFVDIVVLNKVNNLNTNTGGESSIVFDINTACAGADSGDLVYETTFSDNDSGLTCEHDIAVCSGDETGYIISACNLGATTVSTDWTISRGNYFQWGRNKGFEYGDTTNQTSRIANSNYNPDNDTYLFVGDAYLGTRNDWILDQDDNLWGDNSGAGTNEQRQGPCPIGYHVPSQIEWSGIIDTGDGILWNISGTDTEGSDLQQVLKLPYAGYRRHGDAEYKNGTINGFYWLSSPISVYGKYLYFTSSSISIGTGSDRANGFSIRCFKN